MCVNKHKNNFILRESDDKVSDYSLISLLHFLTINLNYVGILQNYSSTSLLTCNSRLANVLWF